MTDYQLKRAIFSNMSNVIKVKKNHDHDRVLQNFGLHSSINQLWERGNYILVNLILISDVKDCD